MIPMPRRVPAIDLKGFSPRERQIVRTFIRRYGVRLVLAALMAGQARGFDPDNPGHTERFFVLIQEIATTAHGRSQERVCSGRRSETQRGAGLRSRGRLMRVSVDENPSGITDEQIAALMGEPVTDDRTAVFEFIALLEAIASGELGGERVEFERFDLIGSSDHLVAVFGRSGGFAHTVQVERDLDPAVELITGYLRAQA
jgi:hypothetical protein